MLLRKDAVSMKLLRKPDLSINICRKSLYVINVAFGYEKNNPARRASEKNNLAPICPKKNSRPGTKFQAPPPEYQMDRALKHFNICKKALELFSKTVRVDKQPGMSLRQRF